MWEVSKHLTSDGSRPIVHFDSPEYETKRILVDAFTKPKRGDGWKHQCANRDDLAKKICDFLNEIKA